MAEPPSFETLIMSSHWQPGYSSHVSVAIFDVDEPASSAFDDPRLLSDQETARAARFQGELLARRYRRAHAALRLFLARETGRLPASLPIARTPAGKPFLEGSDLSFNLSHSGHLAAVVIGRSREVGIDIEVTGRRITDVLGLASAYLHPEEHQRLATVSQQGREPAFLRLWTAREAYLKALGTGLAGSTRDFNAAAFLDGLQAIACDGWTIRQVPASSGVYAAVAASGSGWGYRLIPPILP